MDDFLASFQIEELGRAIEINGCTVIAEGLAKAWRALGYLLLYRFFKRKRVGSARFQECCQRGGPIWTKNISETRHRADAGIIATIGANGATDARERRRRRFMRTSS